MSTLFNFSARIYTAKNFYVGEWHPKKPYRKSQERFFLMELENELEEPFIKVKDDTSEYYVMTDKIVYFEVLKTKCDTQEDDGE